MKDAILDGFFNEISKIAASRQMAGYMQSRSGTRPYRVHTLLARSSGDMPRENVEISSPDSVTQPPEIGHAEPQTAEETGEKLAEENKRSLKGKVLDAYIKAKPYLVGTAGGAIPGALMGNALGGFGTSAGRHAARVGAILGGSLGASNTALTHWAERNRRNRAARELLKTKKEQ